MSHLPPAHHETSKRDSPHETKVKEKQNKTTPDSNSNLAKSMTHHNQTKGLTTWFLNLKGGQKQNRAQKDPIRNIASDANRIGLKAPRSPMLIEHRHSHLN
jgi:hypothetical protein